MVVGELERLRAENAELKEQLNTPIRQHVNDQQTRRIEAEKKVDAQKERIAELERVVEAFMDNITDDGRSYCCGCDFRDAHKLAKEALKGKVE